jgi:hypothetical protein
LSGIRTQDPSVRASEHIIIITNLIYDPGKLNLKVTNCELDDRDLFPGMGREILSSPPNSERARGRPDHSLISIGSFPEKMDPKSEADHS